jgi:hypothetical protein
VRGRRETSDGVSSQLYFLSFPLTPALSRGGEREKNACPNVRGRQPRGAGQVPGCGSETRARLSFNDLTAPAGSRPPSSRYLRGMDARALTAGQREAIRRSLTRHRDYLAKLAARMEALAWAESDPVRVAAVKSRDAVNDVLLALAAAEPAAPFLSHYGPGGGAATGPTESASMPWVGRRKSRRR